MPTVSGADSVTAVFRYWAEWSICLDRSPKGDFALLVDLDTLGTVEDIWSIEGGFPRSIRKGFVTTTPRDFNQSRLFVHAANDGGENPTIAGNGVVPQTNGEFCNDFKSA